MLLQLSLGPDPGPTTTGLVSSSKDKTISTCNGTVVSPVIATDGDDNTIHSTTSACSATTNTGGQCILVDVEHGGKDPTGIFGSSSSLSSITSATKPTKPYRKAGLLVDCQEENEEALRLRLEEEECRKWLQKVRDRRDHQRQISNLSLKLLFPSHSLPKSTTMRLLNMKVCSAIRAGDLKTVKQVFEISTDTEREELLQQRQEDNVIVRRPSNGKDIVVNNPTLLMVSVSQWFVDIVDYLAGFGKHLDEEHIVDDVTNTPRAFRGVTALHVAALAGKLSMVQSLISHGAQVNKQTTHGDTPLFEACFEGHLSVAQYLLNSNADMTIANAKGTTCLMIATYADNAEVIQYLMSRPEAEGETNRVDRDGRSALFYTVAGGRLDTLVYLLENGAKIMSDKHGVNILIEAAHHEQTEIIFYLLEEYAGKLTFSVCDQDNLGRNVLFYLVENKNTKILELLLYHGVPIEPADDGRTFLMTATLKNNKALVKYLLEHANKLGLNPNERDKKGRNALFYCITGGDVHLLELLIAHGVSVAPSADGITILMQAVAKQKLDFTEHILDHKEDYDIDVNARDKDGWVALLYSVASGNLDIFKLLKQHGAQSHTAVDGRTILMQASAKGELVMLDHIMNHAQEYEAYVNQRDEDGWNALFYTIQGNHVDAFKMLIKRGALVTPAKNGATPLMEAVDKGKREMVEYLVRMSSTIGLDLHHCDKEGANVLFYCAGGGHVQLLRMLLKAGCRVHNDKQNRNLLMQAALSGHTQTVQFLILNAEVLALDVLQKDTSGRNAIYYCIEGGHLELLDFLVDFGIPCCRDESGMTPLMQACQAGHHLIVDFLLERATSLSIDINERDEQGENALFYAVRSQRLDVVKNLLNRGAEVYTNHAGINVLAQSMSDGLHSIAQTVLTGPADLSQSLSGRDEKGRTILHHLVASGEEQALRKLGRYFRSETMDADAEGVTLLMTSCRRSRIAILKYLVEDLHVDVHALDKRKRCALYYAVESSNLTAVTYLLSHMKGLLSDTDSVTVLMTAVDIGDLLVAEALLKSPFGRTMVHTTDVNGRNAAHHAAMLGRDGLIPLLVGYTCDMDLQDNDGATPLMLAVSGGHVTSASLLLRNEGTIDAQDNKLQGALHYCFRDEPTLRCVKLLVNYGIDVNVADDEGVTPLMSACQKCARSHISIVTYLLQRGADPFLQDKEGRDAFDYCPFDAEYVKGMMRRRGEVPDHERAALEEYKTRLMADLELNSVLRGLLKEEIFTKTLNFEVMKRQSPERIPKLISLLCMRGERAFRAFCRVLKKEGEHELAYSLQKAAYRKHEEILV